METRGLGENAALPVTSRRSLPAAARALVHARLNDIETLTLGVARTATPPPANQMSGEKTPALAKNAAPPRSKPTFTGTPICVRLRFGPSASDRPPARISIVGATAISTER